jgi:hypothetical protein
VSEEEMKALVDYLKRDEPPQYDDAITAKPGSGGSSGTINLFGGPSDDQDPLFAEAKQVVVESGKASASLLQRRLKVGYARAARLLDELEEAGIVGPGEGAKPREVFTEHLRPDTDEEIAPEDQTMDAGGVVLNRPEPSEPEETSDEDEDELEDAQQDEPEEDETEEEEEEATDEENDEDETESNDSETEDEEESPEPLEN